MLRFQTLLSTGHRGSYSQGLLHRKPQIRWYFLLYEGSRILYPGGERFKKRSIVRKRQGS
ncbi:hypothetical protein C4K03_6288 [Pseudomonas synxantha]|uniref:Uncharacterized protein n=1 Tax=Pseudomonas synxantha TaxID=47883 RepID=A0A3G7UG43_9PSED|nr:hypothetical protein C4K03_6288 [Pseudomonas synxantha]